MTRALLLVALMLSLGCTSSTGYGLCIGALDDRSPELVYRVSAWNVAMGIIFFELVVPPVIVLTDETLCPVGRRTR